MDNEEQNQPGSSAPAPKAEEQPKVEPADWEESGDATESRMLEIVSAKLNGHPADDSTPPPAEPDPTPVAEDAKASEPAPADPEAHSESETSEEEATEESDPQDHSLSPEVQATVDKRIGKEVGKRKAAEEKVTELEGRITELTSQLEQQSPAPAAPSGRLSPAMLAQNEEELNQHTQSQSQLRQWCVENWDGYESDDGEQSYTPEQVRKLYAQVEQDLTVDLPQARQRLAFRQQIEPVVQNAYPEAKSRDSNFAKAYQGLVNAVPEALALPQLKLVVGDSLAGAQLRQACPDQPVSSLVSEFIAWRQAKSESPKSSPPAARKAPALPTRSQRGGQSPLREKPAPKPQGPAGNPDWSTANVNDRDSMVAAIAASLPK